MNENEKNLENTSSNDEWKKYAEPKWDQQESWKDQSDVWKEYQQEWTNDSEAWKSLFEEAKDFHQKAVDGDEKSVKHAFKLLKELKKHHPSNELVEAYLGSTTALLGRDAKDVMERFRFARKGLKTLDQMVKKHPENVEIRILRAFVCYNLPEMYFQRTNTAIEDFTHLTNSYERDNSLFTKRFYCKLLYHLGLCYKRVEQTSEADTVFKKVLSQNPDDEMKNLIEQEGYHEESKNNSLHKQTTHSVTQKESREKPSFTQKTTRNSYDKDEENTEKTAKKPRKNARTKILESALKQYEEALLQQNKRKNSSRKKKSKHNYLVDDLFSKQRGDSHE